jgi:hypothetical protein
MTHDEYCRTAHPEFVINYNFDVSIDGDGGKTRLPLVIQRVFTDIDEAVRVTRRVQRLGGGLLQGIGLMHNHPECEGILCLNKLDELGEEWEEDHLCYYTKPGDADQYFVGGIAHRMGTE